MNSVLPPDSRSSRDPSFFRLSSAQRRGLLWMLGILLVLRLVMAIQIPLTDTTEARYAEMARKMITTNQWIMPQFDVGVPFMGKPPLYVWFSALGMKIFGINEFGSRALIFFTSLGLLVGFFRWGRSERGTDEALAASVILLSSPLFFVCMGGVLSDPVLLLGTSLSMMSFWNLMASADSHRKLWGHLFFVGLAIGMLAKGPIAVLLTGMATCGWLTWQCRWREAWSRVPCISGTLLFLLLTVPWYLAAEREAPGFLRYFLWGEHVQRYLDSGWDGDRYGNSHSEFHGKIWWYAATSFFPWTLFLLASALRPRRIAAQFRQDRSGWLSYLSCWVSAPLIFFSLASNIVSTYTLPAMPALALLCTAFWAQRTSAGVYRAYVATVTMVVILLFVGHVSLAYTINHATKKSHKWLVAAMHDMHDMNVDNPGPLYLWDHRYYSAEFYTGGTVRQLHDLSEFAPLFDNDTTDFLSIRTDHVFELPPAVLNQFEHIGHFKKDELYVERSHPAGQGI